MKPPAQTRAVLAALSLVVLAPAVPGQVPTVLVRDGDSITLNGAAHTIFEVRTTAASESAGRAVSLSTFGPTGTVDVVYGALTGGDLGVLAQEADLAGYRQFQFDDEFGLAASAPAYSAHSQDLNTGQTGLDGAWLGFDVEAVGGTPAPASAGGGFWRSVDDLSATLDGRRWFRGGVSDVPGGSAVRRGLFLESPGGALEPLVLTGEPYPNLPATVGWGGPLRYATVSSLGHHWISPVYVNLASGAATVLMLDGEGLVLGGTLVHESQPIPVSIGGVGDAWDNFAWCGVDDAGGYFFCGDSNGSAATDGFIVRDGEVWHRESEFVDGAVLAGPIRGAAMNAAGDLAYLWSVLDTPSPNRQTIYLEESRIAQAGDAVDLDGDGAVDPGTSIVSFAEGSLSIGPAGDVYVIASVDDNGTTDDVWLHLPRELGERYCAANDNASGGPASIAAIGSTTVAANDLTLRCSGLPRFSFGFFLTSQTQGFVANPGGSAGNLCLGGTIGRFQQDIRNSGGAAAFEVTIDLTMIPRPNGTVAAQAGETWNFTTWFRDIAPGGAVTSNFSDAVSVTLQ